MLRERLLCLVALAGICIATCGAILAPGSASLKSIQTTAATSKRAETNDFIALKAGPRKRAVWYFSGVIRNPLTGAEVVGIEGVETVSAVAKCPVSYTKTGTDGGNEQCYLTKKLFAYVDVKNRTDLIDNFRVRHHSPLRPVTPVKTYAELVTLGADKAGNVHARIEWPGTGRVMQTSKISISKAPELSWLAGKLGRRRLNVVNFMSATVKSEPGKEGRLGMLRRWVSLSPTSAARSGGRSQEYYTISSGFTGQPEELTLKSVSTAPKRPTSPTSDRKDSLESTKDSRDKVAPRAVLDISESSDRSIPARKNGAAWPIASRAGGLAGLLMKAAHRPEAVISYRRYGEGPPWYAVGKACVVEMTGYRFPHSRCLPSHFLALVQRVEPDFFNTSPKELGEGPHSSSKQSGKRSSLKRRSEGDGALSLEWFGQQRDPAEAYKPWYETVGSALRSGYERMHRKQG